MMELHLKCDIMELRRRHHLIQLFKRHVAAVVVVAETYFMWIYFYSKCVNKRCPISGKQY